MKIVAAILIAGVSGATCAADKSQLEAVSMIRLIATPEKFESREILVRGLFRCEFENWALYLTKDDIGRFPENAFWVTPAKGATMRYMSKVQPLAGTPCQSNGKYVTVRGRVDLRDRGHRGIFAGSLIVTELVQEEP